MMESTDPAPAIMCKKVLLELSHANVGKFQKRLTPRFSSIICICSATGIIPFSPTRPVICVNKDTNAMRYTTPSKRKKIQLTFWYVGFLGFLPHSSFVIRKKAVL